MRGWQKRLWLLEALTRRASCYLRIAGAAACTPPSVLRLHCEAQGATDIYIYISTSCATGCFLATYALNNGTGQQYIVLRCKKKRVGGLKPT